MRTAQHNPMAIVCVREGMFLNVRSVSLQSNPSPKTPVEGSSGSCYNTWRPSSDPTAAEINDARGQITRAVFKTAIPQSKHDQVRQVRVTGSAFALRVMVGGTTGAESEEIRSARRSVASDRRSTARVRSETELSLMQVS